VTGAQGDLEPLKPQFGEEFGEVLFSILAVEEQVSVAISFAESIPFSRIEIDRAEPIKMTKVQRILSPYPLLFSY
jgi:hypothetical protein